MHAFTRARHAAFAPCFFQRGEEARYEVIGQKRRIAGDRDDMADVCAALPRPDERGMQPCERTGMARDPIGDDRQPEAGKARRLGIGIERERGHLRLKSRDDMGDDGSSGERGEAFVLPTHAARSAPASTTPATTLGFHRRTLSPARALPIAVWVTFSAFGRRDTIARGAESNQQHVAHRIGHGTQCAALPAQ